VAQIDLKNCDVYLEDGYAGTTTGQMLVNQGTASTATGTIRVNNGAGYAAGVATMTVDGSTGAVSNGERFTVPGSSVQHVISAHTETLGNTTSVTFAPALAVAVLDDAALTFLSGYGAGSTTMLVDGSTGTVTTGDRFLVAGDEGTYHTITGSSATLGNTTSITFTPALASSVANNATVTFQPNQLLVKIGEGNCQWTEKRPVMYTKDRGRLDTVKKGDEEPMEVKLDFTWVFLKSDSGETPSIEDVLKNRGEASDWDSSSSDPCEPYAIDIVIVYSPPCDDVDKEIYRLPDFRYEDLGHDIKQGQVSISGKCNATEPTVVRAATYPY
jgi:hypothetical protein